MKTNPAAAVLSLALLVSLCLCSAAQTAAPIITATGSPIALIQTPAKNGQRLTVTSPAFHDGGDIPFENTQYRGNIFPGLAWTPGPLATKSYVIVMQDNDIFVDGAPVLHWTVYDLPATVTALPAGMAPSALPATASYGPNRHGPSQSYLGPRAPPGPPHHYHLQVFALDELIAPDPNLTYNALETVMAGHVLASGETVGLAVVDPTAPPRPPHPKPAP